MKKAFIIFLIGILFSSCSSSKFFDENNKEIDRSKFNEQLSTYKYLEIPGDSVNHKKLIKREARGKINNREELQTLLENATHRKINSEKPIVVIYYPRKDKCNTTGLNVDESLIRSSNRRLKSKLYQIAEIEPIYIYKNNKGLKKHGRVFKWVKDPEGIFEKTFFKHYYPCSSYVVISKNGEYISYLGEFAKEQVWESTEEIMSQN